MKSLPFAPVFFPSTLLVLNILGWLLLMDTIRGNAQQTETAKVDPWWQTGRFSWRASTPLLGPDTQAVEPELCIKDPSLVQFKGRWHIFTTLRRQNGTVDIEYLNFADWKETAQAKRHVLKLHDQYYCAPQIFFYAPHQRWYLIYQLADKNRTPSFGPFFSTTKTIGDPLSWSKPQPLFEEGNKNVPKEPKWLDFWIICDAAKAHLFYTSLDGRMWRSETSRAAFPHGWSAPQLALQDDIFEASHTYKIKGQDQYLTVIEAQGNRRRYYKAYLAEKLEGPWRALAATAEKPFAAFSNVQQAGWTNNISHGELIRSGVDETMEIDPAQLRFVFQGASDEEYRNHAYGKIPWRLGLLELLP